MAKQYASDQPQGFNNHVKNIAVVGAGGTIGSYIVNSLIAQGKHKVTAITRPDSKSSLPAGIREIKKADYSDHAGLVAAMKSQEVLIITMSIRAPPESHAKLIDAAVEAGIRYIMPNEYGPDISDESIAKGIILGALAVEIRQYIEKVGKGRTHWISLSCSFWYEHGLGGGEKRYGFDFDKKELTLFDDGNTNICTTTWKQSGDAVAKLFALKILPEDSNDKSLTLSEFEDKAAYISSFCNQPEGHARVHIARDR